MAVFFLRLQKVTCPVYTCTVANTGQVTFYKVLEKHGNVYLVGSEIHDLKYLFTISTFGKNSNHIMLSSMFKYINLRRNLSLKINFEVGFTSRQTSKLSPTTLDLYSPT